MPDETTLVASGAPTDQQPPQGTPPASPAPGDGTPADVANPTAKKYADEAAAERKLRKELETRLKEFEDAKLSDQQKLEKRLAELQQQHSELQTQSQQRIVRALVQLEAASLGINPALAARLVDLADIEFNDDGDPKNIKALLERAAKDYGLSPAAQAKPPATAAGGATNPSRTGTNGGARIPLSHEYIDNLIATNPREYVERGAEIRAWLLANPKRGR